MTNKTEISVPKRNPKKESKVNQVKNLIKKGE